MMKNLILIFSLVFVSNFALAIRIYTVTQTINLNDDCVIFVTNFYSDKDTSDPRDDKYMGSDVVVNCRDDNYNCDDLYLGNYLPKLEEPVYNKYNLIRSMTYGEYKKNKERLLKEVESLEKIKIEDNREIKVIKTTKM